MRESRAANDRIVLGRPDDPIETLIAEALSENYVGSRASREAYRNAARWVAKVLREAGIQFLVPIVECKREPWCCLDADHEGECVEW